MGVREMKVAGEYTPGSISRLLLPVHTVPMPSLYDATMDENIRIVGVMMWLT